MENIGVLLLTSNGKENLEGYVNLVIAWNLDV